MKYQGDNINHVQYYYTSSVSVHKPNEVALWSLRHTINRTDQLHSLYYRLYYNNANVWPASRRLQLAFIVN